MNATADMDPEADLEEIWAGASPQALERIATLARTSVRATAARVTSFGPAGEIVRCVSDPKLILDAALCRNGAVRNGSTEDLGGDSRNGSELCVPLRLSGGRVIGSLCVAEPDARDWPDADVDCLTQLAACLSGEIELTVQLARQANAVATLEATRPRLLEAVDRIPALVFERRKVDAARSRYTFFGSKKAQLPAIRKMMEDGGAGDLNFLHCDDREIVRSAILRSNLEETDLDLMFRVKDFDRSIRWVRSQSIVQRNPDGSVVWHGFVFDVSDLVAAREEAEAARSLRDAFLDELDGELRPPLQTIASLAESLASERQVERVPTHARTIQLAADSLLGIVDRVLAQVGDTVGDAVGDDDAVEPDQRMPGRLAFRDGATDRERPQARPASAEHAPAPSVPSGGRILLADDLDLNRKLIADMLGLEGHVVDCVADGEQAVRAASQGGYDLILMDMIMPGMDGIAATRAIRTLPPPVCNVPIVALTANSAQDQLDSAIRAGMDATLTKPMSIDALSAVVTTWTRGRFKAA